MVRYRRWISRAACIIAALGTAASASAPAGGSEPAQELSAKAARAAIAQAERALRRAEAQRVLWTTSEEALRGARRALADGDVATAVAQARIAEQHAELAIAQKSYPPFRMR